MVLGVVNLANGRLPTPSDYPEQHLDKYLGVGMKRKRNRAGWDDDYLKFCLAKILFFRNAHQALTIFTYQHYN